MMKIMKAVKIKNFEEIQKQQTLTVYRHSLCFSIIEETRYKKKKKTASKINNK